MTRPVIVHITGDHPDAVQPRKTRAIVNLIEGTADAFEHRVYSLNRVSPSAADLLRPGRVTRVADDGRLAAWTYAAPPRGLLLESAMRRVADAILADLAKSGLRPALVQGHKLSIEGLAAAPVAAALGIPYALSLQGNTDQKILSVRRDLVGRYRSIYRDAAMIFPFAPWIADWCIRRLGAPRAAPVMLPCILASDAILPPRDTAPLVVSAFHLEHYRLKNAERLIDAVGSVAATVPMLSLEIGGDGPAMARAALSGALARAGIAERGRLIGPIEPGRIQHWMNGAAVFAMPSRRESFGMVFVEALLAGCPIVYPRGRAVDGYFDDAPFALAVDPDDTGAIAAAIATLLRDQHGTKRALAQWQASGAAFAFRREAILDQYRHGLRDALAG